MNNRHGLLAGAALAIVSITATSQAAPVQWAGNSHYYELVQPAGGINWTDAKNAAAAKSFNGLPGHLVTFSSDAEFTFVHTTFPSEFVWIGLTDQVTEGNFQWVTGEPLTYTAWLPNEPNNSADDPGEDWVWYENRNGWGWNDYSNVAQVIGVGSPISYLVEYDSVPEPTGLACFACGGVLLTRRRNRA